MLPEVVENRHVERAGQVGHIRKMLALFLGRSFIDLSRHAERIAVFGADFKHRRQEAVNPLQAVDRTHVVVEVRGFKPEAARKFDLGADLGLDLALLRVGLKAVAVEVHIPVLVAQAQTRRVGNRAPAVFPPFARERQVNADGEFRMLLSVQNRLGRPAARRHNRRRGDAALFEQIERRGVGRVTHAEIVGVNNEIPFHARSFHSPAAYGKGVCGNLCAGRSAEIVG